MAACAGAILIGVGLVIAGPGDSIVPPDALVNGKTYGYWAGKWWKWAMELPVEGNPTTDTPDFDVTDGQTGDVWNLAAFFGTGERTCTIPADKYLMVGLLNTEWSSLEDPFPETEEEQAEIAASVADFIVVDSLFFEIDGVPVENLADFRFQSPQFKFKAPTPWIFGPTGGKGTAVADGYYVMLQPLSPGEHTLHYGGSFDFDGFILSIDMTYNLTQLGEDEDN
jgi:hypothetical protein